MNESLLNKISSSSSSSSNGLIDGGDMRGDDDVWA